MSVSLFANVPSVVKFEGESITEYGEHQEMNNINSIIELIKMAQEGHPYHPNYPRTEEKDDKPIMHDPMIVYRPIGM